MKQKINRIIISAQLQALQLLDTAKKALHNKNGLSHTVEVLLWVLGACAIVGLVLLLAFLLIKNDVFPMLSEKVKEIFNMK